MSFTYEIQYAAADNPWPWEDPGGLHFGRHESRWANQDEVDAAREALVQTLKDRGYQVRVVTTETLVTTGAWETAS